MKLLKEIGAFLLTIFTRSVWSHHKIDLSNRSNIMGQVIDRWIENRGYKTTDKTIEEELTIAAQKIFERGDQIDNILKAYKKFVEINFLYKLDEIAALRELSRSMRTNYSIAMWGEHKHNSELKEIHQEIYTFKAVLEDHRQRMGLV